MKLIRSLSRLSWFCLPCSPPSTASPGTAPYCIAVNGGFGTSGGTTFVARNFTFPDASKCTPWTGYTKTAPPSS